MRFFAFLLSVVLYIPAQAALIEIAAQKYVEPSKITYTPVLQNTASTHTAQGRYWRSKDNQLCLDVRFTFSAGGGDANTMAFSIPSGFTIKTSSIWSGTTDIVENGQATPLGRSGIARDWSDGVTHHAQAYYASSNTLKVFKLAALLNNTLSANDSVHFNELCFDVNEW